MYCKHSIFCLLLIATSFGAKAQVTLTADPVTTTPNTPSFCMDILADDFVEIVNIQFSMNWDINVLRLDSIANINLPMPANFFANLALAPTGSIPAIWLDPWGVGATVPNGTSIFQLCFTIVGNIGDCSNVSFVNLPLNMEASDVNSNGQDIGIVPVDGHACIVAPYAFPNTHIEHVNCAAPTDGLIAINPQGALPPYSFQWQGPNGFSSTDEDIDNLENGTYFLTISDASTPPLTDTLSFVVEGDFDEPTANAGDGSTITCDEPTIELNGISSSMGFQFSYLWASTDGNIVSGDNTLNPTVDSDGTYTLTVTNSMNGCTAESSVVVNIDTIRPVAQAMADNNMDCQNTVSPLNGSGSSTGNQFEYLWTTTDGLILSGTNSLNAEAGGAGSYTLQVRNTLNGCIDTASLEVLLDTLAPIAEAGNSAQIDCTDPELRLDGTASSSGAGLSYLWSTIEGQIVQDATTLTPLVDEAGTYYLEVANQLNHCQSWDSVLIEKDDKVPAVVVAPDTSITCHAPVILLSGDGSATGSGIVYNWTTSDGHIISGANTIAIEVDQAGSYLLEVRDTTNGCFDMAVVAVVDNLPPEASAGIDQSICEDVATVQGNIAPGLTGSWSGSPSLFFDQPDGATTSVEGLLPGANELVWSLSAPLCPDYDRDTVFIIVEGIPLAEDDQFNLPYEAMAAPLNLVANDDVSLTSSWVVQLLSNPGSGSISPQGGGLFSYSASSQFAGELSFQYELCSEQCPSFCDTANVLLNVAENVDTTVVVSNGITPNDDGMNDFFVIPELENSPEDFPNNELIIFNRWGDVVYKAAPYQNDFNGNSTDGNSLPQGTYYYIMRLDLSNNKIYRGDLTILR